MQDGWKYDFSLSELMKLAKIYGQKKDTVDVMSRANLWANDKEVIHTSLSQCDTLHNAYTCKS